MAILRAEREKLSYNALLAARQSWDAWPHVSSPCQTEQAAVWLHDEEGRQQTTDFISLSPQQQAVLQLLVLTQEQERKCLVKLVHGVSLEDLQGPNPTLPCTEQGGSQNLTVLNNGCIKRLRQIHASLQTHNETHTPQEETNSPALQPDVQAHICRSAAWSQHKLRDCSLILLTQLLVLQEIQASTLLPPLVSKCGQNLQVLRDEYESKLRARCNTNLFHLLISGDPLSSSSMLIPNSNLVHSSNEEKKDQSCSTGGVQAPNITAGSSQFFSVAEMSRRGNAADGAVLEEMPYLEILCPSDATNKSLKAEGGPQEKEQGSLQSYEKQGSLIALAWSKPSENDTDCDAEAAGGGTGQSQDNESSLRTQVQLSDISSTGEYTQRGETSTESHDGDEEVKLTLIQADSKGHHGAQSAEKQRSTRGQYDSGLADSEAMIKERDKESTMTDEVQMRDPFSAMERERTMRSLVDMQRKVEQRQLRDRERQLLRVQERLLIVQNRKAEEDVLGLKHTDRLRHVTQDLPQEDKNQQKTVVRERLEQLRRERSYVMQSKRDRNTAGFKELLGPVGLHSRETEDKAE
ncbi:uncharacterized protein LOC115056226 [Echeneis naucrates]|uniref:uncharacterized protein LOC115056226 n=1 Tax=Echeneis naucrates TaxID=173247 RepID=UPI0011141AEF|nr:uncharacterized protein LOC115056226 [Echeneis naucrates]